MPIIKSDVRIIKGDVASVANTINEYLPCVNFKVDRKDITQKYADIEASNLQQSVIKLYLSNAPQIVHLHIEQKTDEQVQVETRAHLFLQFRMFYYSCLIFLLIGCGLFSTTLSSFKFKSINLLKQFDLPSFVGSNTIITISFLVLATIFYIRSSNPGSYANFLNLFYENLSKKISSSVTVIQSGFSFPDLWKSFFLFIIFLSIILLTSEINLPDNSKYQPLYIFVSCVFITLGILTILIFMMTSRPAIATRVVFVIAGLGLCIPIIMYSNAPIELSFFGDIRQKLESNFELKKIVHSGTGTSKFLKDKYNNPLKLIQRASVYYLIAFVLILLLSSALFINIIRIPEQIIRDLKRFLSKHPDSHYFQALQPGNIPYVFNPIIVLIWVFMGVANILGLYFAFSIFEKNVFGTNYLFNSELAILFYENTKITITILLQSNIDSNVARLFHKIIMLIYSIPVIIIFYLILRKNIKSALEGYSLLKKQTDMYEKIEKQLSEQINEVCKSANARPPIIKLIESPDIKAETKYLGFPIFKNVLIISTGTWNELHTNKDELDVLLAHEIWHIKKHTLTRKFLCLLSDYSLFGNGFLALLQNSFQTEKEADDFAVKWLAKKHQNKNNAINTLKSLLERVEEINWRNALFQTSSSFNFSMLKKESIKDKLLNKYDNASKVERLKINLKLLYQMYFGDEILSYFHPSINQRIAWAEENYK